MWVIDEAHHLLARCIGAKANLAANPVGALPGNRLLGQFIAQFDLKFCAIQAAFTENPGNIEFLLFLWCFLFNKSRRSKDESDFLHRFQLRLELLIRIDRKAGCCNRNIASFVDGLDNVVPNGCRDLVNDFHIQPPNVALVIIRK